MKHFFLLTLLCFAEGGCSKRKQSRGSSSGETEPINHGNDSSDPRPSSNETPPGHHQPENEDTSVDSNDASPSLNQAPPGHHQPENEETSVDCSICFECVTAEPGSPCQTPCGHAFHRDCITQWVRHQKNCPNCRKSCQVSQLQDFENMAYTSPSNTPKWAAIAVGGSAASAAENPNIFHFGLQGSRLLEHHYQQYLQNNNMKKFDEEGARYAFHFEDMTQENRGNRGLVRALVRKEPGADTEFSHEEILNALNNYHDIVKGRRTPKWEAQDCVYGHYNVVPEATVTFTDDNNRIVEDAYQNFKRNGGEAIFRYWVNLSGSEVEFSANFRTGVQTRVSNSNLRRYLRRNGVWVRDLQQGTNPDSVIRSRR